MQPLFELLFLNTTTFELLVLFNKLGKKILILFYQFGGI